MKHNHSTVLKQGQLIPKNEDNKIFETCRRFKCRDRHYDFEQAIIKQKQPLIIKKQCPKPKSLQFCQKGVCQYDTTTRVDGPAKYKVLKPIYENKQATLKGWCSPYSVKYDMGQQFITTIDTLLKDNEDNQLLQDHFEKNEARIKNDFKDKISTLHKFLEQLNRQHDLKLSSLGKEELFKKLKVLRENYIQSRQKPLQYLKLRGQKYFEIVNQFLEEQNKCQSEQIKELNPFESSIQFPFNEIKTKEKFIDDIFMKSSKHNKSYHYDQSQNQLIQRLEESSRFVLKLNESHGVSNSFGVNRLKKQEVETLLEQVGSQGKQKNSLAQEFNKSQYLFQIKETTPPKLRRRVTQPLIKEISPSGSPIKNSKRSFNINDGSLQQSPSKYSESPAFTRNGSIGKFCFGKDEDEILSETQSEKPKSLFQSRLNIFVTQNIQRNNSKSGMKVNQNTQNFTRLYDLRQIQENERIKIYQKCKSSKSSIQDMKSISSKKTTITNVPTPNNKINQRMFPKYN